MPKTSCVQSYSAEFREKAVKLVTERGFTIQQVAEQLGCSLESVRRWKEAAKRKLDPELAARIELEKSETKRLRKENAQLKMEIKILKKAAEPRFYNTQSAHKFSKKPSFLRRQGGVGLPFFDYQVEQSFGLARRKSRPEKVFQIFSVTKWGPKRRPPLSIFRESDTRPYHRTDGRRFG